MVICSFKWGNTFFLCKFRLLPVCCCLCSAVHSAHLLSSNDPSGAGFPFPFKLSPKLCISWSQEGTNCISVAGKNVKRLLLNQNKQHLYDLVVPGVVVFAQVYLRSRLPRELILTLDIAYGLHLRVSLCTYLRQKNEMQSYIQTAWGWPWLPTDLISLCWDVVLQEGCHEQGVPRFCCRKTGDVVCFSCSL